MVQTQTPYRVKGVFLETYNCDAGCNCNFGGFPDHGSCEALTESGWTKEISAT